MGIRFEWYNPEKTIMRYIAEPEWNWHDYHRVVRVSVYQMMSLPEKSVHSLIDLRLSINGRFPLGAMAHSRTFGKRYMPALSGNAIVLGMPLHILQTLPQTNRVLEGQDGRVYFVDNEEDIAPLLDTWKVP